jgi:hypothetical protein
LAYSSVTLSVSAAGDAPLRYQWRFNGQNLPGATNATLHLTSIQPADAGDYRALVYNAAGSAVSSNATITLNFPVSILVQPQRQSAVVGSTATFSVIVMGTPPFSYRWRFNGTNLPSAPASSAVLVLTNVQPAQAGDYSVVITNLLGSATSVVATLTVYQATTITGILFDAVSGDMKLSFATTPGSSYVIESKDNLDDPTWQPLQTIPGTGSVVTINDPVRQPPPSQRFYRVRIQ